MGSEMCIRDRGRTLTVSVGKFISVVNVGVQIVVYVELFFFNKIREIFTHIIKVCKFFNLLLVQVMIHVFLLTLLIYRDWWAIVKLVDSNLSVHCI